MGERRVEEPEGPDPGRLRQALRRRRVVWLILVFAAFGVSIASMAVTFAGLATTGVADTLDTVERVVPGNAWTGLALAAVAFGLVAYAFVACRVGTAPVERQLGPDRLVIIRVGEWALMLVALGPALIAVLTIVLNGLAPSGGGS